MSDMTPPPETKQELPSVIHGTCGQAGNGPNDSEGESQMTIVADWKQLKDFPRNIVYQKVAVLLWDDYVLLYERAKGQP